MRAAMSPPNRTLQKLIRGSIILCLIVHLGALHAHAYDNATTGAAQQSAKQTSPPDARPVGSQYDDFGEFMRWLSKQIAATNSLGASDDGESSDDDEKTPEGTDEGVEPSADDGHHDHHHKHDHDHHHDKNKDSDSGKDDDDSKRHEHGGHGPGHGHGHGHGDSGRGRQSDKHCLEAHNKIRKMHRVDELRWDSDLAHVARKHSERLARAGRGLEQTSGSKYGENVFMHSTTNVSCEYGVQLWYEEFRQYSYKDAKPTMGTCHFSQLVWRSTTRVGCAFASSRGGTYLTCNYDPKGNNQGEFKDNVTPPVARTSAADTSPMSIYSSKDEVGANGLDMTREEAETLNLIALIEHDWLGS